MLTGTSGARARLGAGVLSQVRGLSAEVAPNASWASVGCRGLGVCIVITPSCPQPSFRCAVPRPRTVRLPCRGPCVGERDQLVRRTAPAQERRWCPPSGDRQESDSSGQQHKKRGCYPRRHRGRPGVCALSARHRNCLGATMWWLGIGRRRMRVGVQPGWRLGGV